MEWCVFTKPEINIINQEAAWTEEQQNVFNALLAGKYNDEGIMLSLNMERKHYYRIKKQVRDKLMKVIVKNK